MSAIAILNIDEFRARVQRFDPRYIQDWDSWLTRNHENEAKLFGKILRNWQACRPNSIRRSNQDPQRINEAPFLEDLIIDSREYLSILNEFSIETHESFSDSTISSLRALWDIFTNLSFRGNARNGQTGVVGISKAVMLLTNGKVGPAFDSTVRSKLGIRIQPNSAEAWISALKIATTDIERFNVRNKTSLQQAAPKEFKNLNPARIYDMALGPG